MGFRNYIAIIPLTGCAQQIAFRIADKVDNAIALWQPLGCDLQSSDQDRLGQMLYQLATHPNVGAVVFLTMGCAAANVHKLSVRTQEHRPTKMLNMQQIGGTTATVQAGIKAASEMAEQLAKQQREPVSMSDIIMGTKCGASDKTSFEICHPIVGAACDRLVDLGSTVVLSEEIELYAGLDDLAKRAVDNPTAQRILSMRQKQRIQWKKRFNIDLDAWLGDPEAARSASLGHIAKAGTQPIRKVYRVGETIDTNGLVILDGPGSDIVSITSMMAAGCNLLLFTTGIGTAVACPLTPTIKVTANKKTYQKMKENIDLLVGQKANETDMIVSVIADYANGKKTKGELLGHGEMFIPLEGVTL